MKNTDTQPLPAFILHPSSFILIVSLLLSGCHNPPSPRKIGGNPPANVYKDVAGQSVGVMVWADRAVRIEWSGIRLDLASKVQEILSKTKTDELKGTTFPIAAASIVRYQTDHPASDALPITEVAPKLGVSRLIYIEIESFTTRSEVTSQLFRGNALVTMKIVEVANGKAKIGFEEHGIRAVFPPTSTPDGVPNSSDLVMYEGEMNFLARQIVRRVATIDQD